MSLSGVAMKPISTRATMVACRTPSTSRHFTPSLVQNRRRASSVTCSASQDPQEKKNIVEKMALPAATMISVALLFATAPDDALAARSGGRMGGSSFSSRSSMPRASMPRSSGPAVRNYNYYSAPPIISPYGFGMPFFGGGFGVAAPMPFFGIGTLFNFILLSFIFNIIIQTVSNLTNGSGKDGRGKDDDEDDRWD